MRDSKLAQPRLRFTIRALLFVMLLTAMATWWIIIPTQKARWFATTVNASKSVVAKELVAPFEKDEAWKRSLFRHLADGQEIEDVYSTTEVSILRLSFQDVLRSRRRITVVQSHHVKIKGNDGRRSGYSTARGSVTRSGVRQE